MKFLTAQAPLILVYLLLTLVACATLPPDRVAAAAAPSQAAEVQPANAFQSQLLSAHEQWRDAVGAPPLKWSAAAAAVAQSWANDLASRNCALAHNPKRGALGENVFAYSYSVPYQGYRVPEKSVVDEWASEIQYYQHKGNRCTAPEGDTCGHYTQVVWKDTTHVGCAQARCSNGEVWVCDYAPAGNVRGLAPY